MNTNNSNPRILRCKEVIYKTGLSRTTLWRRITAGDFPKPRSLGGKSIGFLKSEVDDWLNSLPKV